METLICLNRIRDKNGVIVGYKMTDSNNRIIVLKSEVLKNMIITNSVKVSNLKLDKKGRLIKVGETTNRMGIKSRLDKLIHRAGITGSSLSRGIIKVGDKEKIYIISTDEYNHILYIPDDVYSFKVKMGNRIVNRIFEGLADAKGNVRVVGGLNLRDISNMFESCTNISSIDLKDFECKNIKKISQN